MALLPHSLHDLVEFNGNEPEEPDLWPENDASTEEQAAYVIQHQQRSKCLFKCIYFSLNAASEAAQEDAQIITAIDSIDKLNNGAGRDNGVLAWKQLILLHNNPTSQNKFIATQMMIGARQTASEELVAFKRRVEKAVDLFFALHITKTDLKFIIFLNGLLPKFKEMVNILSLSSK